MLFHAINVWIRRRKDKIMIQKLIQKIQKTHAPIVVGLDPMLSYRLISRNVRLKNTVRHWKERQKPSGSTTKRS